jgi:hypothetical protein
MSLSKFNVTLPTTDNTGAALVAGQITGLLFTIDGAAYTYAVPAGTALGATLAVPFASLTPAFALGQASHVADVQAVDVNGDGIASPTILFSTAVPAAPTGFSIG